MKWKKRIFSWFSRIENEVMLPFIAVGILVIGAFGAISCYNGYTMQMENEKQMAKSAVQAVRRDLLHVEGRLRPEEIEDKYHNYGDKALRIVTADGRILTGPENLGPDMEVILSEDGVGEEGWSLEYILDKRLFLDELIEAQRYVIVGAVACLLIIVQVSVFLSWSLTKPIRSMSATCRKIDSNRKDYRSYRFEAVEREDEIGQLARTFETLLKNLDNYTKMEYTSRMSATLAHEIKNPLTGIRSGVQVLRGRAEKDGEKLLCDSMLKEIDRVTELINNLFTLSVKREKERTDVSLDRFLREMETLYSGLSDQGIHFATKGESGITALVNENELRQIIHNLMTNSIKAMDKGGQSSIDLKAAAAGGFTEISLTDNGRGMAKEELENAMEPFYTKSINGVGIGLAIVSRLVEQNHGTMEIESAPGEGTTVRMRFERKRNEHEKGTDC